MQGLQEEFLILFYSAFSIGDVATANILTVFTRLQKKSQYYNYNLDIPEADPELVE